MGLEPSEALDDKVMNRAFRRPLLLATISQLSSDLYYILLLAPSVLLHITFSSELHITYDIYYLVMGPNLNITDRHGKR